MLPTTTNLDFYAPPPNHRDQAKQRLNHQREDMFSWRSDAAQTSFHPVTGARTRATSGLAAGPRQVLLKDSQRAAQAAQAERQKNESTWSSASAANVVAPDRRREWRMTGFVFEKDHFSSSSAATAADGGKRIASTRKNLSGRVQDPYIPYFHDSIVLCEPSATADSTQPSRGTKKKSSVVAPVTAFAVTCNRAEAEDVIAREGGNDGARLGPGLASQQKAVELAENMYEGLVLRQATLTGTAVGSPESLDVHLPTSELAFTLRQSYVDKTTSRQQRSGLAASSAAAAAPQKAAVPLADSRDAPQYKRASMYSNATTAVPSGVPTSLRRPSGAPIPSQQQQQQRPLATQPSSGANTSTRDTPFVDVDDEAGSVDEKSRSDGSRGTATGINDARVDSRGGYEEGEDSPYPPYVQDGFGGPVRHRNVERHNDASSDNTTNTVDFDGLSSHEDSRSPAQDSFEGEHDGASTAHEDDGYGNVHRFSHTNFTDTLGATTAVDGTGDTHTGEGGLLPSEAKALRLYAVKLKRDVSDQDTTMVRRQEPLRRGVPVVLPDAWRTPMSY